MSIQNEWWIEVEITPKEKNWRLIDDILMELHEKFLPDERQNIKSWHFFREPTLRFRIEVTNRKNRDTIASKLKNFLDSTELVEEHYFAKDGKKIEKLDEGYKGESETYKRMWSYQKKLWEWGAEMAVEAIKEFKETRANEPPREFQLERIFHLLFNQLNPLLLNEVELYNRCATNRMLVWTQMQSLELDKRLFEAIKKK